VGGVTSVGRKGHTGSKSSATREVIILSTREVWQGGDKGSLSKKESLLETKSGTGGRGEKKAVPISKQTGGSLESVGKKKPWILGKHV